MASTMQGREFPRQSMKSNLISMLQQSDSSVFSRRASGNLPEKAGRMGVFPLIRARLPSKPAELRRRTPLFVAHDLPLIGKNLAKATPVARLATREKGAPALNQRRRTATIRDGARCRRRFQRHPFIILDRQAR